MEHEDFLRLLEAIADADAAGDLRDARCSFAVPQRDIHACSFAGQAPGA